MASSNMCTDSFPSIVDLPIEIISHMFGFLGYSDLQAAGATCKSWREVLCERKFHTNTLVRFRGVRLDDRLPPACYFLQCDRPFRYFELENVIFGEVQKLMEHIGKYAVEIAIKNCTFFDNDFFAMMQMLPHIRHLTLSLSEPLEMQQNNVGAWPKLRQLSVSNNRYLTNATLQRLLTHIDRLETLGLFDYLKRFSDYAYNLFIGDDILGLQEDPLAGDNLMRVLSRHRPYLQELNFMGTGIEGSSLAKIRDLDFGGLDLVRLSLAGCIRLNTEDLTRFLETQSHLATLDLSYMRSMDDDCVAKIVKNNPLLEDLNLRGCKGITNAGVALLGKLKKLRRLDISRCNSISTDGLKGFIAQARNSQLRELLIRGLNLCDEGIKCVALNLSELRVLNVGHCRNGVTDDSVQCIVKNLRWLRELTLAGCWEITDAALIGFKVVKSDLEQPSTGSLDKLQSNSTMGIGENDHPSIDTLLHSTDKEQNEKVFSPIDSKDFEGVCIMNLRGLKVLNLNGCVRITDVSLKHGLKFVELKKLLLSDCRQISLAGIESVVQNCPAIEELNLTRCYDKKNKENILALTKKLSRLRTLHGI